MIQWIQRFESVQQIRREDLDDALREDLQISRAQMDKLKKEFEEPQLETIGKDILVNLCCIFIFSLFNSYN